MDQPSKFLHTLSEKERGRIERVWARVLRGDIAGLQVRKLKGFNTLFRIKIGRIRIIFVRDGGTPPIIIRIAHRADTTYHI